MDEFERLRAIVPRVSDQLIDNCVTSSQSTRNKILMYSRASILLSLLKKQKINDSFDPLTDENMRVTPQQIQCTSVLIDYLHNNPQTFIDVIMFWLAKEDPVFTSFTFISVIPSVFGFFSSGELISLAFPFYCSLINSMNKDYVFSALVPFYCNASTYKFVEYVYEHFVQKFVNDVRIQSKQMSNLIIQEYVHLIIQSFAQGFPLLAHPHQFILRFMQTKGYSNHDIIQFFIHRFVYPQLTKYLLSTPHKLQNGKLFTIFKALDPRLNIYQPLLKGFTQKTIYEIPSVFQPFGLQYNLYIMSPADVDILVQALVTLNRLPGVLKQFATNQYFKEITFFPFYVKVYVRKPRPVDQSYNWRKVVFGDVKKTNINESENFEKIWLQIFSDVPDFHLNPMKFLDGDLTDPQQFAKREKIQNILGDKFQDFSDFCLAKTINDLAERAMLFENYLVHNLALNNMKNWLSIIEDFMKICSVPIIEDTINNVIKSFALRQLFKNSSLIDCALEKSLFTINEFSNMPLQTLIIIENLLQYILGPRTTALIKSIEQRWLNKVVELRPTIKLPKEFSNKYKNKNKSLLLNDKLWKIVAKLNAVAAVPFSMSYFVMIDAMKEIYDLENFIKKKSDSICQFVLAFCDSTELISRFIMINGLFVKTERFKSFYSTRGVIPLYWCRLETSILELLSKDIFLMNEFLAFQEFLIESKFV